MRDNIAINIERVFKSAGNMLLFFEDFHLLSNGFSECDERIESLFQMEKSQENFEKTFQLALQKLVGLSIFIIEYKEVFEALAKDLAPSREEIDTMFKMLRGKENDQP